MSESSYDEELSKLIELKTLTWLPWIGENYAGLPRENKILLIGESHYYDSEKESNHDGIPLFTRGIINRVINKGTTPDEKNTWKLFISTVKLLIPGSSEEQQKKFWSNVAFYNFVQRSVKKKDKKDRTPSR